MIFQLFNSYFCLRRQSQRNGFETENCNLNFLGLYLGIGRKAYRAKAREQSIKDNDISAYIDKRWRDQREYFSNKSVQMQGKFRRVQIFIILLSALSATVLALNFDDLFGKHLLKIVDNEELIFIKPHKWYNNRIVCALLTMAVIVLTGIDKLMQYREEWIKNRKAAEHLKSEYCLYRMGVGQYALPEQSDEDKSDGTSDKDNPTPPTPSPTPKNDNPNPPNNQDMNEIEKIKQDHEQQIADLKQQHSEEIDKLKQDHKQELDGLQKSLDKAQTDQKKLADLQTKGQVFVTYLKGQSSYKKDEKKKDDFSNKVDEFNKGLEENKSDQTPQERTDYFLQQIDTFANECDNRKGRKQCYKKLTNEISCYTRSADKYATKHHAGEDFSKQETILINRLTTIAEADNGVLDRKHYYRDIKAEITSFKLKLGEYSDKKSDDQKIILSPRDLLFVNNTEDIVKNDLNEFINNKNMLTNFNEYIDQLIARKLGSKCDKKDDDSEEKK